MPPRSTARRGALALCSLLVWIGFAWAGCAGSARFGANSDVVAAASDGGALPAADGPAFGARADSVAAAPPRADSAEPAADAGGSGGSDGSSGSGGSPGCFTIKSWRASAPFSTSSNVVSHPLPSFAHDGYYYVHTMDKGGGSRRLYAAKIAADGSLGPWARASSDHGGGPHGFTALVAGPDAFHFRNGHIARYRLAAGVMQGDVELLESSMDTSFGGARYVWDSAVVVDLGGGDRHVFHLGGFSFVGYGYRRDVYRASVPVGSSFVSAGVSHPASRPGRAAVYAPAGAGRAWIFSGEGRGARLWRAEVKSGGALGGFVVQPSLPAGSGNERGELVIVGRSFFAVRGAKVFRAALDASAGLGAWRAQASLPDAQVDVHWGDGHLAGQAHAVVGQRLYVTGAKSVYAADLAPAADCAP